jgi:hypothetical protein
MPFGRPPLIRGRAACGRLTTSLNTPYHAPRWFDLQHREVREADGGDARTNPQPDPGAEGEFQDQGEDKWIVIRGMLKGHNDTPFGRPTPSWPIGHLGGVIGGFSYIKASQ